MLYDQKWDSTTFLSAEILNVSVLERAAMIQVLGMMESGEISADKFTMGACWRPCGTVGCIGGWVGHVMGRDEVRYVREVEWFSRRPLRDLYWSEAAINCVPDLTVVQAAAALRNFLTTGEARWSAVLHAK